MVIFLQITLVCDIVQHGHDMLNHEKSERLSVAAHFLCLHGQL